MEGRNSRVSVFWNISPRPVSYGYARDQSQLHYCWAGMQHSLQHVVWDTVITRTAGPAEGDRSIYNSAGNRLHRLCALEEGETRGQERKQGSE